MKVSLVTSGTYSDYRVVAAFSTVDKAESYKTGIFDVNDDVEEYDLDPVEPRRLKEDEFLFNVHMMEDGTIKYCDIWPQKLNQFINPRWQLYKPIRENTIELIYYVVAKDKDHAIKITNERRASLIASGNWKAGVSSDTFKDDA